MDEIKVPRHINEMARQVTHYEGTHVRSSWNSEKSMFTPAHMLVHHDPAIAKMPWTLLLKLGVNPLKLLHGSVRTPYNQVGGGGDADNNANHPITLAAVFSDKGAEIDGNDFVARLEEDLVADTSNDKSRKYSDISVHTAVVFAPSTRYPSSFIVPPPAPWIKRVEGRSSRHFALGNTAWYTASALAGVLANRGSQYNVGTDLYAMGEALARAGNYRSEELQQAALTYLKRACAKSSGYEAKSHAQHAAAIKYCDPEEAVKLVRGFKGKPHAALGVTLKDTPSDLMIEGLRACCKFKVRETMRYMSRPPTAEEIRACRIQGMMHVIWCMPWEMLEPAIKEDAAAVRSILLKEALSNLPQSQVAMQDHTNRVVIQRVVHERKAEADGFLEIKSGIRNRYTAALALREQLKRLDNPEAAVVLVMQHMHPMERLGTVNELRNDRGLDRAFKAWISPVDVKTESAYTSMYEF